MKVAGALPKPRLLSRRLETQQWSSRLEARKRSSHQAPADGKGCLAQHPATCMPTVTTAPLLLQQCSATLQMEVKVGATHCSFRQLARWPRTRLGMPGQL